MEKQIKVVLERVDGECSFSAMIGDQIVIGRKEPADIVVGNDIAIARRQCKIGRQGDVFYLEDMQSPGGTFLNDILIQGQTQVDNGDIIRMGRFQYRLCFEGYKDADTDPVIIKKKSPAVIVAAIAVAVFVLAIVIVMVKTGSPEYKLKKQLDIADKYLAELSYEQAILAYKAALEIDPMSVDAYLGIAEAYVKLGEYDEALRILQEGYDLIGDSAISEMIAKYREEMEEDHEKESMLTDVREPEEPTAVPTVEPKDERWKTAYLELIENNVYTDDGYTSYPEAEIFYLNDDDIPEIMIKSAAAGFCVYSSVDGQSTFLAGGEGDCYYQPGEGVIQVYDTIAGGEHYRTYRWDGKNIEQLCYGNKEAIKYDPVNLLNEYAYYSDGQQVTLEQFYLDRNRFIDTDKALCLKPYELQMDYNGICDFLTETD